MLEIRNISKIYPGFALEDISFQVDDGDYFILLGPSGAGKTQVLEILAGLVRPDHGDIFLDSREITGWKMQSRPFGLVFQDLAVFPHLTVGGNIQYGLQTKGLTRRERHEQVRKQADALEIGHLLDRMPSGLSGGELQRVALARTLIRNPRYLLLDEPLASLDIPLRQGLRSLLKKISMTGQTIIHVTHDYEEALVLGTQVAVMNNGKIIQSGPADEVFHHPGSEFAARFTGIRNYFPAKLYREMERQYAELENGLVLRLTTEETAGKGYVMIRGEDIFMALENLPTSATNQFKAEITDIEPCAAGFEIKVDAGIPLYARITRESLQNLGLRTGKTVWVSFKASSVRFVRV